MSGLDPALGQLIEAYISDGGLFEAIEFHLAKACLEKPDQQFLWDLIYHAVSHFDLDVTIRSNNAGYSNLSVNRLRAVADALISGAASDVELATRRCLGAKVPGA